MSSVKSFEYEELWPLTNEMILHSFIIKTPSYILLWQQIIHGLCKIAFIVCSKNTCYIKKRYLCISSIYILLISILLWSLWELQSLKLDTQQVWREVILLQNLYPRLQLNINDTFVFPLSILLCGWVDGRGLDVGKRQGHTLRSFPLTSESHPNGS